MLKFISWDTLVLLCQIYAERTLTNVSINFVCLIRPPTTWNKAVSIKCWCLLPFYILSLNT